MLNKQICVVKFQTLRNEYRDASQVGPSQSTLKEVASFMEYFNFLRIVNTLFLRL